MGTDNQNNDNDSIQAAKQIVEQEPKQALDYLKAGGQDIQSMKSLYAALKVYNKLGDVIAEDQGIETKVAVMGNCTLTPLADYLKVGLLSSGIHAEVFEPEFDQWAQQMLDEESELYQLKPSFLVVYLSSLGLTSSATQETFAHIDLLETCINKFTGSNSTQIILVLPEMLEEEYNSSSNFILWRSRFTDELHKRFDHKVIMIDPMTVLTTVSRNEWFASRFWYHGKFPCHPNALIQLGHNVALAIKHSMSLPIKVVVCDLDNTLWGGIVGEDGYENLRLDVHSTGGPFIRLQAFLKELKDKGIVIVAVSKNNEDDVREVFQKRDEMLLKWDDFTMVLANWSPKSENIAHIAKTLNLGLKNFCFIDDSPYEREEVQQALPEVIIPQLPSNPEEYVSHLLRSGLFYIPTLTEEDKKRAELYKKELARAKEQSQHSDLSVFLNSLEAKIYPSCINQENMNRVVQLINKTNQFNLTTRRLDHNSVEQYATDGNVFSYCYRVADKFGDSGLTGVLIASPNKEEDNTYMIDLWLMSCRVMGRTIEHAIFTQFLKWLQARNVQKIIGEYIPTEKNKPVANLYPDFGFDSIAQDNNGVQKYSYNVQQNFENNKYVQIIEQDSEVVQQV